MKSGYRIDSFVVYLIDQAEQRDYQNPLYRLLHSQPHILAFLSTFVDSPRKVGTIVRQERSRSRSFGGIVNLHPVRHKISWQSG